MKQTPPQKPKIILQLLLFIGVVLVAGTLKPHTNPPQTLPTQSSPPTAHALNTVPANSKSSSVKLANATIPPKKSSATVLSPKYEQIKQSVQKEYIYHVFTVPNDPQYAGNWALTKVNATGAWNIATGNGQTVVAVIDTGFGLNHEDLVNQWYQNSGETGMTAPGGRCWTGTPHDKSTNLCDDDNNGYVDDWRGWNFVNGDNNPQAGRANTTGAAVAHATEVSGIVGAAGNNGIGVAALDWNTKIMPLQVLDDDGTGYSSDVTAGIYYAVDNGAKVINMSLGIYGNDPALKTAIDYASAHNVVIVAAAGNCGDGTGPECAGVPAGTIAYPAAYPAVIAVGATDSSDQQASFSSYGTALDVSAPGYAIPGSTSWSSGNPTSLYSGSLYGTSFASPMVASLAALIKSIRPSTSPADVTALIDATATKISGMNGLNYTEQFGHGIINAGTALSIAQTLNTPSATPTLLQAGTNQSEHTTLPGNTLGSGCLTTVGSACTVQLTDDNGYTRYLPYMILPGSGSTGWTWSSDMLEVDNWSIRARSGDHISTTPYLLFKK